MPWYADIVNYLVIGQLPSQWSPKDKKRFLVEVKQFYFDNPHLFKYCLNQVMRRCVSNEEQNDVINFCHSKACGGHFSFKKISAKILQCGFYWPTLFKDFFYVL